MRSVQALDVLVAGGHRCSAQTLVIENHPFFGGIAPFYLGMPINQVRPGGQPRSDVHELLIGKLLNYGVLAVRIGEHQLWCHDFR